MRLSWMVPGLACWAAAACSSEQHGVDAGTLDCPLGSAGDRRDCTPMMGYMPDAGHDYAGSGAAGTTPAWVDAGQMPDASATADAGSVVTALCGDGMVEGDEECDLGSVESAGCVDCVRTPGFTCTADDCELTGCVAPLGSYAVTTTIGPSMGSCVLTVTHPDVIVMEDFWNELINPMCTGSKEIALDGCSLSWQGTCPLTGSPGHSEDHATFTQVSPDRIEATSTLTHVRSDGTRCSVSSQLILTRIPGPHGQACHDDGACASRTCCPSEQDGPGACTPPTNCATACNDVECGVAHNVDCGNCEGLTYCSAAQRCEPACVDKECGMDMGVACGNCEGLTYCSAAQQCEPACVDKECGIDMGVACGSCEGLTYCGATQHCEAACVDMECGTDMGVTCGTCTGGLVCDQGSCVTPVCPPGESYCEDNVAKLCSASGLSLLIETPCAADEYCDDDNGSFFASCEPQLCEPGETACGGSVLTQCNAEGSGVEPSGTDCALSGLDCTPLGCGNHATDSVGYPAFDDAQSWVHYVVGNYYAVTTTTTLLTIEQYIDPPQQVGVTWVVYQSPTAGGSYTRVFSETGTVPSGVGYKASGTVGVQLLAGYHYIIGMASTSDQIVEYYTDFDVNMHPVTTSFGRSEAGHFSEGSATATLSPDRNINQVHVQRLSTATYP